MSVLTTRSAAETPILATKLFAPRLRDRVVRRARLISALDQAPGLVLVSAPAGFGKSTILADWLRLREVRSAWLSLEPADSEPRRFLTYLAGALGQLAPALGATISPCLQAPHLPPAETILLPLINELSRLEGPNVLILDDYHTIEDDTVHGLIEHWIDHLPPRFCLVLSTRVDPPFSLSRWRGQGWLTELRAADLRFSADESHTFLRQVMRLELPMHLSSALQQRTEGWIVGLQMAALSMRGQPDVAPFVSAFTGSHRFVLDYLTDEVLARQPPAVLDFLLRAALLERFSAPLCDHVLERADSRELLAKLEAENLFLTRLDEERRWFRFHHLFRQLLKRQLALRVADSERRQLQLRACDWLAQHELPEEALGQALAAGDQERAIAVLERFAERTLEQADAATAMRWFDRVPLEWVEARPRLALTRALALFLAARWTDLEHWSSRLQKILRHDQDAALEGRTLTFTACAATIRTDRAAAIRAAQRALELLPREDLFLRAVAAVTLGVSRLLVDDYDAARAAFADAARWSRKRHDPLALDVTCGYYQGRIDLIRGHTREADDGFRRAWARDPAPAVRPPMSSLALIGQAEVGYECGQLERAAALAQKAIAVNRGCFPFNEMRARLVLVDIARAQRDFALALEEAEVVLGMMQDAVLRQWQSQIPIHRMRILALQATLLGDPAAASEWAQWAREFDLSEDDDPVAKLLPEEPRAVGITLGIRWLLYQEHRPAALLWAQRLQSLAAAKQWHRVLIESWLLVAQAHREQRHERVLDALKHAFELAEPSGFVQVLAEEREWLRGLPERILGGALAAVAAGFRARVLEALGAAGEPGSASVRTGKLVAALSARELEILAAVAAGGTNAAVGRALFISPRTVKKHLENIYGKLDVHNRGEAVHRARALGLLHADSH